MGFELWAMSYELFAESRNNTNPKRKARKSNIHIATQTRMARIFDLYSSRSA